MKRLHPRGVTTNIRVLTARVNLLSDVNIGVFAASLVLLLKGVW